MTGFHQVLIRVFGVVILTAPFAVSGAFAQQVLPPEALNADVLFLGEQHDNAGHHSVQAAWVEKLFPTAVVFEMLTADQAEQVDNDNRLDKESLETALGWADAGWPNFSMYYPIFAAAPNAEIVGAGLTRDQIRALMQEDLSVVVGSQTAVRFGLDQPLPDGQKVEREALQREAHCNALPDNLLPRMVTVQRVRDASLAEAALTSLQQFGRPVVVITGNGHAREDWGAPFLLRFADPDVKVFTLGQGEAGQNPTGEFRKIVDGPAVDRGDPCDAFK